MSKQKLMPSDIEKDVHRIIAKAKKGKGPKPHWLTAYQILARLDAKTRQQLITERGRAGKGSGSHFAAASVVMAACRRLARRKLVEIDYLDAVGARFLIGGASVEPGNKVCGIYRV